MMQQSVDRRYFLYGAAATPRPHITPSRKIWLKMLADRARFKLGFVNGIDYRNYIGPYTYNRGDHAITIAASQQIQRTSPRNSTVLVDWGNIQRAQPAQTDVLIVCGSGYFFPNSKGELPDRITVDLRDIRKTGVQLQLLGVGFNYLLKWPALRLSSKSEDTLNGLLELCSEITVRDRYTKQFLAPFTAKDIDIVGDPALFIDVSPKNDRIQITDKNVKIGINIPFHGARATSWIKNNLAQFINVLRRLRENVPCDFFYFIHYDSEVLIAALLIDSKIPVNIVDVDVADLPREYARMDIHIGGMLHSCILATAAGTPSVCLAYDKKHYGFFELIDSLYYCVNADQFNAEILLQKVFSLLESLPAQRSKITRRRDQLAIRFEKALQKIVRDGR